MKFIQLKIQALLFAIRVLRYYYFFKSHDIIIFNNLTCRFKPHSIKLGKNFTILHNVILEFNNTANISIGDHCLLSYGVLMALKGNFVMGKHVMIGEYTSIRDYTHDYLDKDVPMVSSKDIVRSIKIGNNVWIGRGCLIMQGTIIEDNVVIGANSTVKGLCKANSIYAGSPAKFIKSI